MEPQRQPQGQLLVFIWIGLLSLSADINSTSDTIRRGLTAIGSRQEKAGGRISVKSCGVWRVSEVIDNSLARRMILVDLSCANACIARWSYRGDGSPEDFGTAA